LIPKCKEINEIIYDCHISSWHRVYQNYDEIEMMGFQVLFSVAKEKVHSKEDTEERFQVEYFPLNDGDPLTLKSLLEEAVDKLHKHISNKKKIYLHCNMGISRAPTTLTYYLMKYHKYTFEDAYQLIKSKRSVCEIDPEFQKYFKK
jgi:protein-tyrosine phosphatase